MSSAVALASLACRGRPGSSAARCGRGGIGGIGGIGGHDGLGEGTVRVGGADPAGLRTARRQLGRRPPGRHRPAAPALDEREPGQTRDGEDAGHVHVQPQAEEVLRRVHPERLLEDPERGIARHVQREQAGREDLPVMAEPDQGRGQRHVPDQLVQERRLEEGEGRIPGRPVGERDLQAPRQARRPAEQFLVEVVPDPADTLRDQQRGRHRIHDHRDVAAGPAGPPDADQDGDRYRAPDAEATGPYREHAVPDVRDVHRRGDIEVDPAADDPGRHAPQGDVVDQLGVPAGGGPAAAGDDDRGRDADQVHQRVDVDEQRADVEAVDRRAGNVQRLADRRGYRIRRHAPQASARACASGALRPARDRAAGGRCSTRYPPRRKATR